jgi:peptide deformylase
MARKALRVTFLRAKKSVMKRKRPIVQTGHPVLRQVAEPVDPALIGSKELETLIDDMIETMRKAPGVGLAAPQIGVSLQVAVLEDREELLETLDDDYVNERDRRAVTLTVLINPNIEPVGDGRVTFYEGCLSVAGFAALTERHEGVRVRALDRQGNPIELRWKGWPARILQHEIDHLHGTLYIDRMDTRTFTDTQQIPADEEED